MHSLKSIGPFNVRAGETYDYKLLVENIPNAKNEVKPRTIEVFSTDDELIIPPNGKSRNTVLLKEIRKAQQDIPICIHAACASKSDYPY